MPKAAHSWRRCCPYCVGAFRLQSLPPPHSALPPRAARTWPPSPAPPPTGAVLLVGVSSTGVTGKRQSPSAGGSRYGYGMHAGGEMVVGRRGRRLCLESLDGRQRPHFHAVLTCCEQSARCSWRFPFTATAVRRNFYVLLKARTNWTVDTLCHCASPHTVKALSIVISAACEFTWLAHSEVTP